MSELPYLAPAFRTAEQNPGPDHGIPPRPPRKGGGGKSNRSVITAVISAVGVIGAAFVGGVYSNHGNGGAVPNFSTNPSGLAQAGASAGPTTPGAAATQFSSLPDLDGGWSFPGNIGIVNVSAGPQNINIKTFVNDAGQVSTAAAGDLSFDGADGITPENATQILFLGERVPGDQCTDDLDPATTTEVKAVVQGFYCIRSADETPWLMQIWSIYYAGDVTSSYYITFWHEQ